MSAKESTLPQWKEETQMRTVERDLERILTLLRNRIRERGFTQMEVQEVLGWGRSYISQLLTQQKNLRFEQVLQILNVINVDPAEFWAEIYQFGPFREIQAARLGGLGRAAPSLPAALRSPDVPDDSAMLADLRRSRRLLFRFTPADGARFTFDGRG